MSLALDNPLSARYQTLKRKLEKVNAKLLNYNDPIVRQNISEFDREKIDKTVQNFKYRTLSALATFGLVYELAHGYDTIDVNDIVTKEEFESDGSNTRIFVSSSVTEDKSKDSGTVAKPSTSVRQVDLSSASQGVGEIGKKSIDNTETIDSDGDSEGEKDLSNLTIIDGGAEADSQKSLSAEQTSTTTTTPVITVAGAPDPNRQNESISSVNMSQKEVADAKERFMKVAGSTIHYKFDGDPLNLEGFLTDVAIVEEFDNELIGDLCFKFIKGRLTSKALLCCPSGAKTVAEIKAGLKEKISQPTQQQVENKIMALRVQKGNIDKFVEQAEKLSEALRTSLILRRIPDDVADEMATERMVQLCRQQAKIDMVSTVIGSGRKMFKTPIEVLETFQAETEYQRQQKKSSDSASSFQREKQNKHYQRGKGGNHGKNNGHSSRGGNKDHRNNNGGNGRGQSNGNKRFNNNNRNNGGKYNNNRNEHVIRFVAGPSTSQEQAPPAEEQFFRLTS